MMSGLWQVLSVLGKWGRHRAPLAPFRVNNARYLTKNALVPGKWGCRAATDYQSECLPAVKSTANHHHTIKVTFRL